MTEQQLIVFPVEIIRILETNYTTIIEERLHEISKDLTWAKKLFSSDGTRKFSFVFAPGNQLEFRVEITTTIKVVVCGLNILPGGQATLTDHSTYVRTLAILQKASKHLLSSDLVQYRKTLVGYRSITSDSEIHYELLAIPRDDMEVLKTDYVVTHRVRDKENGNVVEVSGKNEPSGALLFNARVKLQAMRRDDD